MPLGGHFYTAANNAEQIRSKLFDLYQVSIPVMGIRKFLRESGMVYKRTRHSLKKKE